MKSRRMLVVVGASVVVAAAAALIVAAADQDEKPAAVSAGAQSDRDAALQEEIERNKEIAREQVVGERPAQQLIPGAVPPGFRLEALADAPDAPTSGAYSVTIYGRDPNNPRGPVLTAVTDRSGRGFSGPQDERISPNGRRAKLRTRGRGLVGHWVTEDETFGAVFGRGVGRAQVEAAVAAGDAGQRPLIGSSGRPSDFRQLETGDPWGALGRTVGGHLMNGTLLRYENPDTGAFIEVSMARGEARLERLAQAAIASEPGVRVRTSEGARGPLAFDPTDGLGAVWREGSDVVVVTGVGVADAELDVVIASLRPAAPGEFELQRASAASYPPRHTPGATVLFDGTTADGSWSWAVKDDNTEFAVHFVDGTTSASSDALSANPRYEDGTVGKPLPIFGTTMQGIGEGQVFVGGLVDRPVAKVEILLADGSQIDAPIDDAGSEYPVRFFGTTATAGEVRAAIAFGRNGEEVGRVALG